MDKFSLEFAVRDYECDIQGFVNNGVYQNYMEHSRHEYLKYIGIDFNEYAKKGINFVVVRVEIDYKFPLQSGDKFFVEVSMERLSRVKFAFNQDIYRIFDNKLIVKGKVIGTALNERGRPEIPDEIEKLLENI